MVSENIKEAVRKCNPQKAIYALGEIVDSFQAGITNAQSTADQAIKNAEYAASIANAAQKAAEEATQNVGEAFDTARASPNSSTVIMEYIRINGNGQNVALPVVNTTNAGILNANDYKFFQEYDARIRAVEGVSKIYLVELPSDNPSSQQITLAYTSQWADAPNPPLEGTVVVDPARNNLSYRWNTQSNTWYKISEVAIQQFTNTTLGTIKGSTQDGEVQANADGTGSVTGWDIVKGNIATLQENAIANIRGIGNSEGMNLELINQNNSIKNTVALPVATNTSGGIMSPEIMNQINSLGMVPPILILKSSTIPLTPVANQSAVMARGLLSKYLDNGLWARDEFLIYSNYSNTVPTKITFETSTTKEDGFLINVQDTINTIKDYMQRVWYIRWYSTPILYLQFKIYPRGGMNNTTAFYQIAAFPSTKDPYIATADIQVNGTGIINISVAENPDLVGVENMVVVSDNNVCVALLSYIGTVPQL